MKALKNRLFLTAILAAIFLQPATGESLTLEQIILMARENNPELLEAENNLASAENDLVGDYRWEDSSVTFSGDWDSYEDETYKSLKEDTTGTISLSVEVIDQVSLSSSIETDGDVSTGITVQPFNMTDTTITSQTTWDNARTDLIYTQANLDWEVLNLALNLALAEKNARWAQEKEVLENDLYQASYALYLAEDITYEELLDAMDDLTDAEDDSLTYASSLLDASQGLWTYLSDYGEKELVKLTLADVEVLATRFLNQAVQPQENSVPSQAISQARNALKLAERERDITMNIHPTLSVSAELSGDLDDSSDTKAELSVSLSLSEGSFNKKEREILTAEVKVKEAELNQALYERELEKESLSDGIEQSQKASSSALRDLERKQILADETDLLFARGERTILEKKEADLDLIEAENKLFQRYTEEIEAATDYLSLFPGLGFENPSLKLDPENP
jgi:outer membrane protein TolC